MLNVNYSNDYLKYPNPIDLVYYSKTGEGTYTSSSVQFSQRNLVTQQDLQLGAVSDPPLLQQDMMIFHIWHNQATGLIPKLGDKLNDGVTDWIVKIVQYCDFDTIQERYRLTCIRTVDFQ